MEAFLQAPQWYWLVGAVLLAIAEAFVPGTHLIWLGVAAAVVGVATWVAPGITWQVQVTSFALLSVVVIFVWRRFLATHPGVSDNRTLNRRGDQYVGRRLTLVAPIVNGLGKVQVDDTAWKVRGQDLPEGTRVKVVGIDGTVMLVEPAEAAGGAGPVSLHTTP